MQRSVLIGIIVVALVAVVVLAANLAGRQVVEQPAASPAPDEAARQIFPTLAPAPVATPVPTSEPTDPGRPIVDINAVIQAAINAGDQEVLKPHLAATVQYTIFATECCPPMSGVEALKQLRGRIDDEVPYDFSPTNPKAAAVRAQATSLTDYQIGIASNGYDILAYHLGPSLKIDAIYEADGRLYGITP